VTICLILPLFSQAQSKASLEKERAKIISEIEKTNSYLKNTQKEKSTALTDLKAIKKQVQNRKKLIDNVNEELTEAAQTLEINKIKRDSLSQEYDNLRKQYASILRYNYMQNLSNQKLSYLLSSESLNTFLLRYRYIKQFEAYQNTKKDELNGLRSNLYDLDENIKIENEERQKLIQFEKEQYDKLQSEEKDKDKMVKKIGQKEDQLKKELKKKRIER
jgi:septal ring factor EnvC (AmiA/AmiB activator)